jgi:hypothetical protein
MLYAMAAITTVMIIINRFTPNIAHRLLLMINPANDGIKQKMSRVSVVIVIPNAAAECVLTSWVNSSWRIASIR